MGHYTKTDELLKKIDKKEFLSKYYDEEYTTKDLMEEYGLSTHRFYELKKLWNLPRKNNSSKKVTNSKPGRNYKKSKYYDKASYELLLTMAKNRNVKLSTLKGYESAVKFYVNFHKKTLVQLIKEARKEQEKGVDVQKSKLKMRLLDYRKWLVNESKISNRTIKTYFSKIKTIYLNHDIILPNLPDMKLDKDYVTSYNDLPSKKHIQLAVNSSDLKLKSIILFQVSSGSAKAETLSLTKRHYFEAISDYVDVPFSEDKSVLQSILIDIDKQLAAKELIVPTFYLRRIKTDKYYYTFCTPEACECINQLVTQELSLAKDIKKFLDQPLFNISNSLVLIRFQEINDKNNWGYKGKYRFFRSHVLRKYNASNLPLTAEDIDNIQGRSRTDVHEAYIKIRPETLRQRYMAKMHHVCISKEWENVCKTLDKDLPLSEQVQTPEERILAMIEEKGLIGPQSQMPQSQQIATVNSEPTNPLITGADALFKYAQLVEMSFLSPQEFKKLKKLIIGDYISNS